MVVHQVSVAMVNRGEESHLQREIKGPPARNKVGQLVNIIIIIIQEVVRGWFDLLNALI